MSAYIICDLGFGDSGKGSWTDFLARQTGAELVVRYNGGAQAAHTVVLPDGRQHVFSQFGSATLVEGVQTLLSRFMLVNPMCLAHEASQLQQLGVINPYSRLFLDERALVTTPYQVAANRIVEFCRGDQRHGSCGLGIGETMIDWLDHPSQVLRCGDLKRPTVLAEKLAWHRQLKQQGLAVQLASLQGQALPEAVAWSLRALTDPQEYQELDLFFAEMADVLQILSAGQANQKIRESGEVIFEGAQGVLLDEWRGFHPHTTWSTTTPANAKTLLQEAGYTKSVTTYGLLRAYTTRHGAGPLPTEDRLLTMMLDEPDNPTNLWQGQFRVGWLDLPLLRYALRVAPVDALLISALDRLPSEPQVATGYRWNGAPYSLKLGPDQDLSYQEWLGDSLKRVTPVYLPVTDHPYRYAAWVAEQLHTPLAGLSFGKTHQNKQLALRLVA